MILQEDEGVDPDLPVGGVEGDLVADEGLIEGLDPDLAADEGPIEGDLVAEDAEVEDDHLVIKNEYNSCAIALYEK